LLLLAAGLPASVVQAEAERPETETRQLEEGWQYRWGDSPFVDGAPLWTTFENPEVWKPIAFPSDPPGRDGRTNVWYRVRLPAMPLAAESLYIHSIDLIGEIYFRGERIYHFGHFDANGKGRFQGWPWHLVKLPPDAPGEFLYFRIYSDYPDIGLWGEVKLGREAALISQIVRREIAPFAVGVSLLFFGLCTLGAAAFRRRWTFLLMGLFLLNLGLIPIQESQLKQLLVFAPLAWQYVAAGNYFLLPVTMAGFVHALYGPGPRQLHRRIWQVHLVFFIAAMALSAGGWINLSITYVYFDWLALFSLLALSLAIHRRAWGRDGTPNLKLLSFGFWLLYGILLFNGLVAHGILPFTPRSEYLGPLALGFCFAAILFREYRVLQHGLEARTRELGALNRTLEDKIAERTAELEQSKRTKDQFFAIIAHDLRGPVGTIANLLDEYEKDGRGVPPDDTATLRDSAGRTYRLLQNLLVWARGQRGELEVRKKHFDLKPVLRDCLEPLRESAFVKGIDLGIEAPGACLVSADEQMVRTVVRNLGSNAIKFGHPGGFVKVSVELRSGEALIRCADDGLGIPSDQLEHLFSIKARDELRDGTYGEKGNGLGLLLSREFVELNGGRIGAESRPGEGTTVWFTLPLAQAR